MKKFISIIITAALCALPFRPARADDICNRVQAAVTAHDRDALAQILSEQTGIPTENIGDVTVTVTQTPVNPDECSASITAPDQLKLGCVLIVLGVDLGLIGITIYVVYKVCNPPPPGPDTLMYMDPQGQIWEPYVPVPN